MATFDRKRLPQLVLYSKSGSLPYLSWNLVRKHQDIVYQDNDNPEKLLTMMYLGDLCDLYENSNSNEENSKTKFSQIPFLENTNLLVTVFDPLEPYGNLKSTPKAIPFNSCQGKKMITIPQAFDMIDRYVAPKYFQVLADINVPPEAKSKWTTKAVGRTEKMLVESLDHLETCNNRPKVFGTVTGGYSEKSRLESCRALCQQSSKLAGVIIESFYGYNKIDQGLEGFVNIYTSEVDQMLSKVIIPELPPTLPRALFGAFMPDDMLRLIAVGVDFLDTSVCTLLTKQGMALPHPLITLTTPRRLRFVRMTNEEIREHSGHVEDSWPESIISLSHVGYVNDQKPISSCCKCHVCYSSGYSRAYINHMLKRGEINAYMLLQIHNHWTITMFMSQVRNIIHEGLFPKLMENSNLCQL